MSFSDYDPPLKFSMQVFSVVEPPARPLKLAYQSSQGRGDAEVTWVIGDGDPEPGVTLIVSLDDGRSFKEPGLELFECLFQLRRAQLDPLGIKLGCNGARLQAWATGMLRQQGGGYEVYLTQPGLPARFADLVRTFDPAPLESIATAAEQLECFQRMSTETKGSWLLENPTVEQAISRQLLEAASWRWPPS